MADAYIVDAVRSPTGKRRGGLAEVHGADLGAHVLRALVDRNGIPEVDYDDVMFGCLDAIGPLAGDIARTCWLAAGLPDHVPGVTIDRQCGSSQQAVHFAERSGVPITYFFAPGGELVYQHNGVIDERTLSLQIDEILNR